MLVAFVFIFLLVSKCDFPLTDPFIRLDIEQKRPMPRDGFSRLASFCLFGCRREFTDASGATSPSVLEEEEWLLLPRELTSTEVCLPFCLEGGNALPDKGLHANNLMDDWRGILSTVFACLVPWNKFEVEQKRLRRPLRVSNVRCNLGLEIGDDVAASRAREAVNDLDVLLVAEIPVESDGFSHSFSASVRSEQYKDELEAFIAMIRSYSSKTCCNVRFLFPAEGGGGEILFFEGKSAGTAISFANSLSGV